jgi:hypothetical protein
MKKMLFLVIIILSGCKCLLSQIPPQRIYAGIDCTAPIPNYLLKISATDNCEIASITQIPIAGTLLTATNKVATVTIRAVDATGNFKQIVFTVTLLDTVKPVLTIDPTLLSYQMKQVDEIYDFAESLISYQEKNLMQQSWIDSVPGLREKLAVNEYSNKTMLTWSSKDHNNRVWSFFDADKDTIVIRR